MPVIFEVQAPELDQYGVTWLHEGTGFRCERHDETFPLTSSCPACAADPGPSPEQEVEEPLPPPPPGCLSTVQIEAVYVADADRILALIVALDPPPSKGRGNKREPIDVSTANAIGKLYAERTKLIRAAATCAREREHEIIVRRREKRERDMQRGASH